MEEKRNTKFHVAPKEALKLSIDEFINDCKEGCFTDYDGIGFYGTDTQESNIAAYPSMVKEGLIEVGFSHVYWYNK